MEVYIDKCMDNHVCKLFALIGETNRGILVIRYKKQNNWLSIKIKYYLK